MSQIRSSYTDSINFYGGHSPLDLAQQFGTPLYVYNETVLRQRCRELKALSSLPGFGVNYSVKANTNPVLLRIIREEGLVVDAMSPGELYMDQLAGFTADEILYISNNISEDELRNAVRHGVLISVDSLSQVETLGRVNPGGKVMVRFNPGIGAGHHAKVVTAGKETKFGVSPELLDDLFAILKKYDLHLAGINQHIGSLFMEADGYIAAAEVLLHLAERLPADVLEKLEVIDFGGGFGMGDLFSSFFSGGAGRSATVKREGRDMGVGLRVTLEEVAAGVKKAGRKRPATLAASWWSQAAMWWPNAASCWGASTPPRPTVTDAMPVPTWASTCWCVPPCTTPSMMWKCTVRARRARIPRPWNRASWATSAKAATSWPRTASCLCCMKATCWACWTPGLTVS